jgi:hypothetical protein
MTYLVELSFFIVRLLESIFSREFLFLISSVDQNLPHFFSCGSVYALCNKKQALKIFKSETGSGVSVWLAS